jgi:hypothetical protein
MRRRAVSTRPEKDCNAADYSIALRVGYIYSTAAKKGGSDLTPEPVFRLRLAAALSASKRRGASASRWSRSGWTSRTSPPVTTIHYYLILFTIFTSIYFYY